TARFHTLDFLREDRGELHPKHLRQLGNRYPHSAAQFGDNKFLRWLSHGKGSFGSGVESNSRHRCAHYTCLREGKGENSQHGEGHEQGYFVTEMWRLARLQICNRLP